jgi:hypothetical protein
MPTMRRQKTAPRKPDFVGGSREGQDQRYVYSGCAFIDDAVRIVEAGRRRKNEVGQTVYMPKWTALPGGGGILEFDSPLKPAPRTRPVSKRRGHRLKQSART